MKKAKKIIVSTLLGITLIASTCISVLAFSLHDDNGHGYVSFGTKGSAWIFSYCYYDNDSSNHFAVSYLDGRTNGKAYADPGTTACSHSPSLLGGGKDTRDWGKY